jgi:hypothetical protein
MPAKSSKSLTLKSAMDVTENNIIQASTSHSQKRCLQAKKMRIADLEEIFRRIVLKLKFELGDQAEIRTTTDLYRLIPTDKWSKFEKPERLELGFQNSSWLAKRRH